VDREDAFATFTSGRLDDDAAIEATGTQQRRIEYVGRLVAATRMTPSFRLEAVIFDQQLIERLLAFVVSARRDRRRDDGRPRSISSMNTMHGAFFLPCSKRSRTREAPTPTNISTKSEPADREKTARSLRRRPRGPATSSPFREPHQEHALRDAATKLLELLRAL